VPSYVYYLPPLKKESVIDDWKEKIRQMLKQLDPASDRDGGNAFSCGRFLLEYGRFQQIEIHRNGNLQVGNDSSQMSSIGSKYPIAVSLSTYFSLSFQIADCSLTG
jgi:hypothetical protein